MTVAQRATGPDSSARLAALAPGSPGNANARPNASPHTNNAVSNTASKFFSPFLI
jgi:hypothetical protein